MGCYYLSISIKTGKYTMVIRKKGKQVCTTLKKSINTNVVMYHNYLKLIWK